MSLLLIVSGTVKWGSEAPLVILAQHLDAERVLMTQVGERQDVRLANGSSAVLNTDTKAIVHESWGRPKVDLISGEILFETVTGHSTPLRVAAGIEIETTYAKFSVFHPPGGPCTVRVYDGEVVIYADGAAIQPRMRRGSIVAVKLTSGRAMTVWPDHSDFGSFDAATAKRLRSWLNGNLMFKDDRLADVVAEFNRYNREKLEVADDSIGQIRIGGSYPATDPQRFAEELRFLGIRALRAAAGEHGELVIVLTKAPSPMKRQVQPPNHDSTGRTPGEAARSSPYSFRPREGLDATTL